MQLGGDAVTEARLSSSARSSSSPDFLTRDQSLEIDLDAVDQTLQAYDQIALKQKIAINRKLSPHWTVSAGVAGRAGEDHAGRRAAGITICSACR